MSYNFDIKSIFIWRLIKICIISIMHQVLVRDYYTTEILYNSF
jgi:hypothetical protein